MTWSSARPGLAPGTGSARWAPEAFDLTPLPEPAVPAAIPTSAAHPGVRGGPDPATGAGPGGASDDAMVASLVAAAFAEGHDAGRLEGERAEQARLRFAREAAEDALDAVRAGEARWAGAIEENICALAVAVARHVIGRDVVTDPAIVADLVRRAIEDFGVEQGCRIRLHPQDHALLVAAGADAEAAGTAGARWVADPSLTRGGCVVEGRERIVDGRVDTALERLYRRLTYTGA